jgi:sulfur carrier protein ThiS
MTTATPRKKPEAIEPVPVTFDEIARRKVRERIESYREIVTRRADGKPLTVADMERAGDLLDHLGLPGYAFERDTEAVLKFRAAAAKLRAAEDAVSPAKQRAEELGAEIEVLRQKLVALREEHRLTVAKVGKPTAYSTSVAMLQNDHPNVLADLDVAVRLRLEELDRRKNGGAA